MKELLKVTQLKGSIVSAELNCSNEEESRRAAAAIATLMAQNEVFANDLTKYVSLNVISRAKLKEASKLAIRSAEIKTKN